MDSGNSLVSASQSDDIACVEIERDDTFYFSFVTFKVENRLFRVPKHELAEQSHVFRDMFSIPPAEGRREVEGMSDDKPIHLEAIDKEAFKLLLKVLYFPKAKDISALLTLEQCESLLGLSRLWDFEEVRLLAKDRIRKCLWDRIDAVEKVNIAHDYEVEEWYVDAYYELATRPMPLSVEEARSLGWEFSIKMAQVREKVAAARPRCREGVAREAIGEIFKLKYALEQITAPEENSRVQVWRSSTGGGWVFSPILRTTDSEEYFEGKSENNYEEY